MNKYTQRILEGKMPRRGKREKQADWEKKVQQHEKEERELDKRIEKIKKDPEALARWQAAARILEANKDKIDLSIYSGR